MGSGYGVARLVAEAGIRSRFWEWHPEMGATFSLGHQVLYVMDSGFTVT